MIARLQILAVYLVKITDTCSDTHYWADSSLYFDTKNYGSGIQLMRVVEINDDFIDMYGFLSLDNTSMCQLVLISQFRIKSPNMK